MVSTLDFESSDPSSNLGRTLFIYLFMYFFVLRQSKRLRGAMVARLTPDQKAACSNHVGVKTSNFFTCLIFMRRAHFGTWGSGGYGGFLIVSK